MIANFFRWTARFVSLAIVGLFLAFIAGEGPPPLWPLSLTMLLFCLLTLSHAGLLIAWRWELAGGLLSLAAIAGLYLVDFINSEFKRFPGGWVFPLIFFTGLLYVLAASFPKGDKGDVRRFTSSYPSH